MNESYEVWRISYQSDGQAARAAYVEMMRLIKRIEELEQMNEKTQQ